KEGVAVDGHVPEVGGGKPLDGRERSEEPAGEIDQVDALIDELTAARPRAIGAPFPVVADAPAVSVASAHEHQGAQHAAIHDLARLLQRGMITVIEPDAHAPARGRRARDENIDLRNAPGG